MKIIHFILFALLFSGCSIFDNAAPTPVFIEIPSVSLSTTVDQGDPQHKITDVWINANGEELGIYPLPARIPVIIDDLDSLKVTVFPGIRNNGSNDRPFLYTLLEPLMYDIPISPGETTVLTPQFEYSSNAKFDFVESFEGSNIFNFKGATNSSGGCLEVTSEDASTGNHSGKITVTKDIPIVEVGTDFIFDGENNIGSDSYLEFDYKGDVSFLVGIYKTDSGIVEPVYNVIVREKDEWNRIYIDFTLDLNQPTVTDYRAMFLVLLGEDGPQEATVYLDNIKMVHF